MGKLKLPFCGLVALAAASISLAGTISGTVRGLPPPPAPETGGGGGAYESRRYKFVEKIDYGHLRDFVVYIDQDVPGAPPAPPADQVVKTTQRDANFDPHVLPVAVGTTVSWPNEDDIFHNVFSMSDASQFDLGYYKKDKTPTVTFDKVGKVDVFCAIHSKMHCIILVLPNRFFAMADAKGHFEIKDVPPGTYKVRAWHEQLPSQVLDVTVPATGEVRSDFTLSLANLPKR
jgi:plastocyanin